MARGSAARKQNVASPLRRRTYCTYRVLLRAVETTILSKKKTLAIYRENSLKKHYQVLAG
jgi:hypothetical protein